MRLSKLIKRYYKSIKVCNLIDFNVLNNRIVLRFMQIITTIHSQIALL